MCRPVISAHRVGAQTVERAFPELVQTDSTGRKSADYGRLTAPIIEAMRQLSDENEALKTHVKILEDRTAWIDKLPKCDPYFPMGLCMTDAAVR